MQWLYGFHKFIILVSPTAIKLGAKAFTTSDYARHDIFTGHTKRIAAGNPYARLNDPRATTTGLVPLLGGLARTGLIRQSASRVLAAAHRIAEAIIEDPTD